MTSLNNHKDVLAAAIVAVTTGIKTLLLCEDFSNPSHDATDTLNGNDWYTWEAPQALFDYRSADSVMRYTNVGGDTNCYAEIGTLRDYSNIIVQARWKADNQAIRNWMRFRYGGGGTYGYGYRVDINQLGGGNHLRLYRMDGASETQLAAVDHGIGQDTNFVVELRAVGSALKVLIDGVELISVVDTTYQTGIMNFSFFGFSGAVTADLDYLKVYGVLE